MPVVFRVGGARFFFYSNEGSPREPPHIHVEDAGSEAKAWLRPEVELADSFGFSRRDFGGAQPGYYRATRRDRKGVA